MSNSDFTKGIKFLNTQTIHWGARVDNLLKRFKPEREINGECLTLIWGDVKLFGVILSARTTFFPEETLVKDRKLHEMILIGEIEAKKHIDVIDGINEVVGDPTGHLELANLSSHNWIHDEIEVSSNFITNSKALKVVIRKYYLNSSLRR